MKDLFQGLNHQIDTIDEELVYLLYRRFEIIKEMNDLNNKSGDTQDIYRKQDALDIMIEEAKDKGVNEQLVTQLHELIYAESLKLRK